jgi:cytochrome c oxidase cbb3-type subunit I/II
MAEVSANYDANTQEFTGTDAQAQAWAALYEEAKALFTQKCLPCHSCSGNGQGTYARQTLAHPANLNERISNFPEPADAYHFWRVSEGVGGTAMPPWGWSLDSDTIFEINTYEMSFVNGSLRTVSGDVSDGGRRPVQRPDAYHADDTRERREDFIAGQNLYNMYCVVCHGQDGKGNGPRRSGRMAVTLRRAGELYGKRGPTLRTTADMSGKCNMAWKPPTCRPGVWR